MERSMEEAHRILVVEDDDALRRMLAVSLGRLAQVVTASNVDEAMSHLRAEPPPSVVVTDVMMPGTSGIELARTIKKTPRLADVAVVMLSAKTGARDLIDGINAGVRHYVTKPFKSSDLEQKVAKLLKASRRTPAPPAEEPEELELELEHGELVELPLELEVVEDV
jgi:DNA-binding response OmpR family regulator